MTVQPVASSEAGRPAAAKRWWTIALVLGSVLVAPLLVVEAPPLLDFLNHIAGISILATGQTDPDLARIYAAHWTIIPNLGLDLLLTPVMHILPPLVAGRIAVGFAILLPVAGTIAYSRAVFGVRSYWPLGSVLVAYNATLLLGFMNFLIAVGLALLLAAVWIRDRERRPTRSVLLGVAGGVALFFCHLMGLALFLVLIGAFEFAWACGRPLRAVPRVATSALVIVLPAILYALSPFAQVSAQSLWYPPADKLRQLLVPFVGYDPTLDALSAAAVGIALLYLLARHCRIPLHAAIALLVLLAAYAAAPFIAKGTCFLDTRFAIMLGYLVFGAILPAGVPRPATRLAGMVGGGLFAWRMATIALVWHGYQHDLDQMRAVIAPVQPGARVYVTSVAPEEAPAYWRAAPRSRILSTGVRLDYHLPALLVLERRAFWPFLFADPAQQPIALREPYRQLAEQTGPILAHAQLRVADSRLLCDYDYVLLLNAGGEPDLQGYGAGRLKLLRARDVAALYQANPSGAANACGMRQALSAARP